MKRGILAAIFLLVVSVHATAAYIEIQPISFEWYVALGNYFSGLGDNDAAQLMFERSIAVEDSAIAEHNLGIIHYETGNIAEAEEFFRNAINLDENYAKAHNSLALLLFEQDRLVEAADEFAIVVDLQPKNAQAHFDLGVSVANIVRDDDGTIEDLLKAIHHFTEAEQLQPGYPHAQQNVDVLTEIVNYAVAATT